MQMLRKLSAVVLVATVAACSDSTGPNGNTLTQAEKQALVSALSSTDFGGLAAIVVQQVGQVGSLSAATVNAARSQALNGAIRAALTSSAATAYEGAVGIAVEFTETQGTASTTGYFYGVVGWNGINTSANTIDQLVLVGGVGDVANLPSSVSGTVESGDVFALYSAAGTLYTGTSGTAAVTGSSFSGSGTDCSASGTGFTYTCNVVAGTISTNFAFEAINASQQTFSQTAVQGTNLPAVKMSLNITFTPAQ